MNILYICHRFPYPPNRGGKIRPFNTIRHMTQRGHRVYVGSVTRSEAEASKIQGISAHCEKYHAEPVQAWRQNLRTVSRLPTLAPSSFGYFYSRGLAAKVQQWLRDVPFDLIFVHCSSVAQYVSGVTGIPKILDFGDMDSQKWLDYSRFRAFPLSLGFWLEGVKLERIEKQLARSFDFCTTTTRAELDTLNSYGTGAETGWFPNGVDSSIFSPAENAYEPHTLSFIGRMDYYPNQECMINFCHNTLPLLRVQIPNVRLLIIGASPPPHIQRLAELPGVTVTGSVPDVRPYVHRSAVMVAPLNVARGTQNKILEAMAMGVPVVSSHLATRGVDCVEGEHQLSASTPQEYTAAILRVLRDPAERARLGAAGRQFVLSHHSWPGSMQRLDAIMERVLSGRRSA